MPADYMYADRSSGQNKNDTAQTYDRKTTGRYNTMEK